VADKTESVSVVVGPLVSPSDGQRAAPRAARRARTEEGGAAFAAAPPVVALTPADPRASPETRKPNPQKPQEALSEAVESVMLPDDADRTARCTLGAPIAEACISHAIPAGCRVRTTHDPASTTSSQVSLPLRTSRTTSAEARDHNQISWPPTPQASYAGVEFYPTLEQEAAALLERLVKKHALLKGIWSQVLKVQLPRTAQP